MHHARDIAARKANRGRHPDSRCQTAQCSSFPRRVAAPGLVGLFAGAFTFPSAGAPIRELWPRRPSRQQQSRPPMRGDGAPKVALFLRSRLRSATTHPGANRDRSQRSTWRFSDADPRSRLPAVEPEPAATSRARPYDWRSGSGPPCGAVRAASAGRHPLAPSCRIVSRKRPL